MPALSIVYVVESSALGPDRLRFYAHCPSCRWRCGHPWHPEEDDAADCARDHQDAVHP